MASETTRQHDGRDPNEARMPLSWAEGQGAPEWIMWMPGGTHEITASQRGKPRTLTVTVDRQTAALLQQALGQHLAGGRQKPFLDFDHDRKAASGWPQEFAWREQPEPGVYCRVEWSQAGRAAVEGRTYRSFSPAFYETNGRVDGAPLCMGSLLNDPAFEQMAPIWSGAWRGSGSIEAQNTDVRPNHMSASNTELPAAAPAERERLRGTESPRITTSPGLPPSAA